MRDGTVLGSEVGLIGSFVGANVVVVDGISVGGLDPSHAPTISHVSLHFDEDPPGAYIKLPQFVPMHLYITPSRDTSVPML
jgi:hypothetical protein